MRCPRRPALRPSILTLALTLGFFAATALSPTAAQCAPTARSAAARAWLGVGAFAYDRTGRAPGIGGFVLLGFAFDGGSASVRGGPPLSDETARPPPRARPVVVSPILARAAVQAAWRASGVAGSDASIDAILSRARWSSLLPEARVRAVRFDDDRYTSDLRDGDTDRTRDAASSNTGLEARLTWRLDRLVYSEDEPSLERIRSERRDARARIASRTLEALFHWVRAEVDLERSEAGSKDELDATLRLYEAEAVLDVLTAGWFGRNHPRALRLPPPPGGAPPP